MVTESGFVLAQRAASEGPRWTRAVGHQPGSPPEERNERAGKGSGETAGMVSVLAEPPR